MNLRPFAPLDDVSLLARAREHVESGSELDTLLDEIRLRLLRLSGGTLKMVELAGGMLDLASTVAGLLVDDEDAARD